MKTITYRFKALTKCTYLLISMIVLFIGVGGCAGISHDPGERKADVQKGRIHSMNGEIIPKLVGSWKLISFYNQYSNVQTAYPFGKDAQGRIIYEPDGRMAVQLMNPNRPPALHQVTPLSGRRPKYGRRSVDTPPTTEPIQLIPKNKPSRTGSRPPSSPTGWGRNSGAISNLMGSI